MLLSLEEAGNLGGNSRNKRNELGTSVGGEPFLHERRVDLFHQLAPLLLRSPMLPTDALCVMWAMAKVQHLIDMGIFDRLTASLASEGMLERSNTRLISQEPWSCGRMAGFEGRRFTARTGDGGGGDASATGPRPPTQGPRTRTSGSSPRTGRE